MLERKTSSSDDLLAYRQARQADDLPDISFARLLPALLRRWLLIAGLTVVSACAGVVFALSRPPQFTYTSTIEIATLRDDKGDVQLIEPAPTVLAKVIETYIVLGLNDYAREHPDEDVPDAPGARTPLNSGLVVLESAGSEAAEPAHGALHEKIIARLADEHEQRMKRAPVPEQIELERLQAEAELLQVRLKRQEELRHYVQANLTKVRQALAAAEDEPSSQSSSSRAVAAEQRRLRLRSEIESLEERLQLGLPVDRDFLLKEIADNQRAQAAQRKLIESPFSQSRAVRRTRALSPPIRSLAPISRSRSSIVLLATGLGFVVGLMLAILASLPEARPVSPMSSRV